MQHALLGEECAERVVAHLRASKATDMPLAGEEAVVEEGEERWEGLLAGEIARRAEDDDGDNAIVGRLVAGGRALCMRRW